MFILIIFYSLISGFYFLKELNELCNANELMANIGQCKSAVRQLKNTGTTIHFQATGEYSRYPKGCFLYKGVANTAVVTYWNTHASGNSQPNSRPICKTIGI